MVNSFIKQLQTKLQFIGLYKGSIDGIFGSESYNAVLTIIEKASYDMNESIGPAISTSNELPWIAEARKHIGLKEIKGSTHNKTILQWVKNLGGWFTTDEIPWCGTFVAQCLQEGKRGVPKHWYRALDYKSYGTRLSKPCYGSIGVKSRTGGGHVTFIVGMTADRKHLVGLGGNQSDAVNLMKFPISDLDTWVWPSYASGVSSSPYPDRFNLPIYSNDLKTSTKES